MSDKQVLNYLNQLENIWYKTDIVVYARFLAMRKLGSQHIG